MLVIRLTTKKGWIFGTRWHWKEYFPPLRKINETTYSFRAEKGDLPEYIKKAKFFRLEYSWIDARYERSSNYRGEFFRHYHSWNHRYRCVYCGKRVKDVTVDHIIPVKAARDRALARFYLFLTGIRDVNHYRNLVPCCEKCNRKKADKIGLYPLRAMFGRSELYWTVNHLARAALLFGAGYLILKAALLYLPV